MNRLLAKLILLSMVTSCLAGTLKDNFNDGKLDGWSPLIWDNGFNSIHKAEKGDLVLKCIGSCTIITIGEKSWADYTVSVRVKIVKQQSVQDWIEAAGIVLRITPNSPNISSFYAFYLGTFGFQPKSAHIFYTRPQGGGVHNFKSESFEWKLNRWYRLQAVANGNQFKCYVDGKLILEYKDSTYQAGQVGLAAACHTTIAHFDDFMVSGDQVPDFNLSVTAQSKLATVWEDLKYTQ